MEEKTYIEEKMRFYRKGTPQTHYLKVFFSKMRERERERESPNFYSLERFPTL